jgi:hypothetical protein
LVSIQSILRAGVTRSKRVRLLEGTGEPVTVLQDRAAPTVRSFDTHEDAVGRVWTVSLVACVLAGAVWAGFAPLADPDLPMHLSVGEWIVRHGSVPRIEPFAWTRAGAPYYAYSWLAQVTFYELLALAGPLALHALGAALGAGAVAAGAIAGRAMRLSAPSSTLLGALNLVVAMESTPFLRPQLFMFVLVPIAWACAAVVARERSGRVPAALPILLLTSAFAANIHLTFPVLAATVALPLVEGQGRRVVLCVGAIGCGWLLSPYGALWLDVFRLNFASGPLTSAAAPIGELAPGFLVAPVLGLVLASLPLLADATRSTRCERIVFGVLWLAGLLVFGRYFKGLGPWWWCATPLCVAGLRRLPTPSPGFARSAFAILLPTSIAAASVTNVRLYRAVRSLEGDVSTRTLPSLKGYASEPAARWLKGVMSANARGRLLTTFNYGSYLKWRLPNLSESIDSRGIFPDSAALPDVPTLAHRSHVGPWSEADVAIVPTNYPVATLLDHDARWQRVGVAPLPPWAPDAPQAGLWVKRAWFARSARAGSIVPVPAGVLP